MQSTENRDFQLNRGQLPRFDWTLLIFATRGKHTLQVGGLLNRYQLNTAVISGRGTMPFPNLQAFMLGKASSLATRSYGTEAWRATVFGWYVEDDVRLTRHLTVNIGFRHDFMTPLIEKNGDMANLLDPTDPKKILTYGLPQFSPRKDNFQPWLGIAWDVFGNGKTAAQGGVGIFQEQPVPGSLRGRCCPQPNANTTGTISASEAAPGTLST